MLIATKAKMNKLFHKCLSPEERVMFDFLINEDIGEGVLESGT